jgi:hypothetical protein
MQQSHGREKLARDPLWNVLDCKTAMNQSDYAEQIESPAFWRKALNRTVDCLQIKSSYR